MNMFLLIIKYGIMVSEDLLAIKYLSKIQITYAMFRKKALMCPVGHLMRQILDYHCDEVYKVDTCTLKDYFNPNGKSTINKFINLGNYTCIDKYYLYVLCLNSGVCILVYCNKDDLIMRQELLEC